MAVCDILFQCDDELDEMCGEKGTEKRERERCFRRWHGHFIMLTEQLILN